MRTTTKTVIQRFSLLALSKVSVFTLPYATSSKVYIYILAGIIKNCIFFVLIFESYLKKYILGFIFNVNLTTERLGFEAPTLVQAQAIPVVLSGRHV